MLRNLVLSLNRTRQPKIARFWDKVLFMFINAKRFGIINPDRFFKLFIMIKFIEKVPIDEKYHAAFKERCKALKMSMRQMTALLVEKFVDLQIMFLDENGNPA